MDVENIVERIQEQSGCSYFAAVSSAECLLKLEYQTDVEKLAEIKDAISKLRLKNEDDNCKYCKIEMEIYEYDEYKLCCPKCGFVMNRDVSYVPTSTGYIIYEPSKPAFNPNRHFAEWLNQILGKIIPKDKEALKTIRRYIKRNNIREISPESLRNILKDLGLSKYYKYTSFFFKELTNYGPPSIPEELMYRANFMFKNIVKTRTKICEEETSFGKNNPSYPYLIYKIFDFILPISDTESRRIFQFIHLPSDATLKKRDAEWNIILNKSVR